MYEEAHKGMCPHCQNDASDNSSYQLLVSVCGHELCSRCVDDHFRGRSVLLCLTPQCGTQLQRAHFERKVFASALVHRDVKVRARLAKVYDVPESRFGRDAKGYNAFLEFVEDQIYNLVHRTDEKATEERVRDDEKSRAANKFTFYEQLVGRFTTAPALLPAAVSASASASTSARAILWPPPRSARYGRPPAMSTWFGPRPPPTPEILATHWAAAAQANPDPRLTRAGGGDAAVNAHRALCSAFDHLFFLCK